MFLLQIKGSVGATEVFMGRFYGITLLTSCLTWYKTKGSLDATVPLTVMLSRLFVSMFDIVRCVLKSILDIFDYNLKTNYQILIQINTNTNTDFGTNVSDTTCRQMPVQFPSSPICFCTA